MFEDIFDFDFDFGLDGIEIAIGCGLYAVMLVVIWFFNAFMFTWDMPIKTKILLSVLMLPITFGIIIGMRDR